MPRLTDDDYTLTIVIPTVPGRALSPNARVHWGERSKDASVLRYAAFMATMALTGAQREWLWLYCGKPGKPGLIIDAEFRWPKGRKRVDDDNGWAMLKAARDGVAEAAQINDVVFSCGTLTQTRGVGETVFTIRRVPHAGQDV